MFDYLFTFRSLTAAQRARSVLNAGGIRAPIVRTAKRLSANGCGYAIRVGARDGVRALHLLRGADVGYAHLYRMFESGSMEEVRV